MQEQTQTQKWWQSRTIQAVLALIAGAIAHFLASFGVVQWDDIEHAKTVYPDIDSGIAMIQVGRIMDGLVLVGGSLAIYFRKTAKKLIS